MNEHEILYWSPTSTLSAITSHSNQTLGTILSHSSRNELDLHGVITVWIAAVYERQTLVAADISTLKSSLMTVL